MIETLLARVAEHFGLSVADLRSRSKRHDIVVARWAAAYVLRQRCAWLTLDLIGQHLGGRDHSTISYALDKIADLRNDNAALAAALDELAGRVPMPAAPTHTTPAQGWWIAQGRAEWFVRAA